MGALLLIKAFVAIAFMGFAFILLDEPVQTIDDVTDTSGWPAEWVSTQSFLMDVAWGKFLILFILGVLVYLFINSQKPQWEEA